MKKKFKKRFQLNKTTVAHLSNQEKKQIKGGLLTEDIKCITRGEICATGETCPSICIYTCPDTICNFTGPIVCGPSWFWFL